MTLQSYEDLDANAIDNTPLAIAKEEGEAAEVARRRPMVHASKAGKTSDLHQFARLAAKLVFAGCEAIGMPKEQVRPMKTRMAVWVNIVDKYAKDFNELRSMEMADSLRLQLHSDMLRARDDEFEDLFGA